MKGQPGDIFLALRIVAPRYSKQRIPASGRAGAIVIDNHTGPHMNSNHRQPIQVTFARGQVTNAKLDSPVRIILNPCFVRQDGLVGQSDFGTAFPGISAALDRLFKSGSANPGSVQFFDTGEAGLVVASLVVGRGRTISSESFSEALVQVANHAYSLQSAILIQRSDDIESAWTYIEEVLQHEFCDAGVPVTVYETAAIKP